MNFNESERDIFNEHNCKMDESINLNDASKIKIKYNEITKEIKRLTQDLKNSTSNNMIEFAQIEYYIATYYSKLAKYREFFKFIIISDKASDNQKFYVSAENQMDIYNESIDFIEKANKHFNNSISYFNNNTTKLEGEELSLYYHCHINYFDNLAKVTPILSILFIEDFQNSMQITDLYNMVKFNIIYCNAYNEFCKISNNGFDDIKMQIEYNCNIRINNSLILIYDLYNDESIDLSVKYNVIDELLKNVTSVCKNEEIYNIKWLENLEIETFRSKVKIESRNYKNILTLLVSEINMRPSFSYIEDIVDEFIYVHDKLNVNVLDRYEQFYTISQMFNFLDKISYMLIKYIDLNVDENKWDLNYIFSRKLLEKYNEPNFRSVIAFIKIIKSDNFSEILKACNNKRNIATHKIIEDESIEYSSLSRYIKIIIAVYLYLSITAIEIDNHWLTTYSKQSVNKFLDLGK